MGTALIVTRLIFDYWLHKGWLKSMRMLRLIRGANIDFLRWAVPAFIASWLIIAVGLGFGIYRGKGVMGIDFVGGQDLVVKFDQHVPLEQLRPVIEHLGVGEAFIGYQTDLASGKETLRVTTRSAPEAGQTHENGPAQKVLDALKEKFPNAGFAQASLDTVGATVGAEIQRTAVLATILALAGILVYVAFRYEFSFAVASIVAIIHDLLMTIGWFFLMGRELNSPMVAAVLTIIGFSINDTIVIFDRIREDLRLGARGTFKEIINRALNETLSRTIITSGTTLLAALALYLFGGGSINDFAFTVVVGIITGTYSTIYIASALVLWWHKGQRPTTSKQVVMETPSDAVTARGN
jgi:SecD/SecF fusion protein